MLTQHIYWSANIPPFLIPILTLYISHHLYLRNLDAFQGSDDILAHHLHIDSSRVVAVDGDAIPTGEFIDVAGTAYDFRTPERIDYRWNDTAGFCGGGSLFEQTSRAGNGVTLFALAGCIGYDNCWIYDHNETSKPGISLWSDLSGIRSGRDIVHCILISSFSPERRLLHTWT